MFAPAGTGKPLVARTRPANLLLYYQCLRQFWNHNKCSINKCVTYELVKPSWVHTSWRFVFLPEDGALERWGRGSRRDLYDPSSLPPSLCISKFLLFSVPPKYNSIYLTTSSSKSGPLHMVVQWLKLWVPNPRGLCFSDPWPGNQIPHATTLRKKNPTCCKEDQNPTRHD